jgi:hypothetical protein
LWRNFPAGALLSDLNVIFTPFAKEMLPAVPQECNTGRHLPPADRVPLQRKMQRWRKNITVLTLMLSVAMHPNWYVSDTMIRIGNK